MISMSQIVTIRQLRKSGESIASINRIIGVSRDTVYKYLALDDLSPKMSVKRPGSSMMDQYRSIIESWLVDDGQGLDAREGRNLRHRRFFCQIVGTGQPKCRENRCQTHLNQ